MRLYESTDIIHPIHPHPHPHHPHHPPNPPTPNPQPHPHPFPYLQNFFTMASHDSHVVSVSLLRFLPKKASHFGITGPSFREYIAGRWIPLRMDP